MKKLISLFIVTCVAFAVIGCNEEGRVQEGASSVKAVDAEKAKKESGGRMEPKGANE